MKTLKNESIDSLRVLGYCRKQFGEVLNVNQFATPVKDLTRHRASAVEFGTMINGDAELGEVFAEGAVPMVGVLLDLTCEHCEQLTKLFARIEVFDVEGEGEGEMGIERGTFTSGKTITCRSCV